MTGHRHRGQAQETGTEALSSYPWGRGVVGVWAEDGPYPTHPYTMGYSADALSVEVQPPSQSLDPQTLATSFERDTSTCDRCPHPKNPLERQRKSPQRLSLSRTWTGAIAAKGEVL